MNEGYCKDDSQCKYIHDSSKTKLDMDELNLKENEPPTKGFVFKIFIILCIKLLYFKFNFFKGIMWQYNSYFYFKDLKFIYFFNLFIII